MSGRRDTRGRPSFISQTFSSWAIGSDADELQPILIGSKVADPWIEFTTSDPIKATWVMPRPGSPALVPSARWFQMGLLTSDYDSTRSCPFRPRFRVRGNLA